MSAAHGDASASASVSPAAGDAASARAAVGATASPASRGGASASAAAGVTASGDVVARTSASAAASPALLRAEGYRLLGLALAYPDPAELRAELEAAPPELGSVAARLLPLVDDDLPGEHTRLFSQTAPVSACEGHYVAGDKGVLLGQLATLYELFGARPGGLERESADHVGVEIEFAALLSVKEALAEARGDAAALEVTRRARRVFMQEHLGRFSGALGARLVECAEHPFYAELGRVLASWVAADVAESGFVVERPVGRPGIALPVVQPEPEVFRCGMGGAPEEGEPGEA